MLNKLKQRNEGFTIIEVLIVLAIAGLILLVVFLAVPALQRNARNTTTKNDVAAVLGGISEYAGANDGSLPTGIAGTGTVSYTGGNATTAKVQGTTAVSLITSPPATAPPLGSIQVYLGHTCGGTVSARAVAAYYSIEATSGAVQQCQDS